MGGNKVLVLSLCLLISQMAQAKFEVHEWGTFTSLVGSNGVTQNGMYHEDEALPDFVHGFGDTVADIVQPPVKRTPISQMPCRSKACLGGNVLDENVITQKMETPVLYFYSDIARDLDVNVKFPEGVITETFPAPLTTLPSRRGLFRIQNGDTTFRISVLPPGSSDAAVPPVSSSSIYSHARNVASNLIKSTGGETEKFIFYRGLGRYQPTFNITSFGGSLEIGSKDKRFETTQVHRTFLIDVDASGDARLIPADRLPILFGPNRHALAQTTIRELRDHHLATCGSIVSGLKARQAIIRGLVSAGLYIDEAEAMVATWENGYLKVPGLRVLSILPRAEVDSTLPLSITPAPDDVKRVFVSRIEVLLDTDEQKILADIKSQQSKFDVKSLGRFAEPKLRRVLEVFNQQPSPQADAATQDLISSLIDQAKQMPGAEEPDVQ